MRRLLVNVNYRQLIENYRQLLLKKLTKIDEKIDGNFRLKKSRRRKAAVMLLHIDEFHVEDERGKCGDSAADSTRTVAEC